MKPSNGVLILTLGILSFVLCGCLTGIPAWVMGSASLDEIDRGIMEPSERGLIQAGRILGMINTALVCCYVLALGCLVSMKNEVHRQQNAPRCTTEDSVTHQQIEVPCEMFGPPR